MSVREARGPWTRQQDPAGPRSMVTIAAAVLLVCLIGVTATLLAFVQSGNVGSLVLAGSAGASAACLSVLLKETEASEQTNTGWALALAAPVLAGFAAGGFSMLLAYALLGVVASGTTSYGAAVFGGVYGLLLGNWSQRLLKPHVLPQIAPTIESVLNQISSSSQRTKFSGQIEGRVSYAHDSEYILGVIAVRFVPRAISNEDDAGLLADSLDADLIDSFDLRAGRGARAQILVEDGESAPAVPFVLTVVPQPPLDVLPRSRAVVVPSNAVSEIYEFTLLLEAVAGSNEIETANLGVSPSAVDRKGVAPKLSTIIVDVSQSGRTTALMELSVAVGAP